MCGVIGAAIKNPTRADLDLLMCVLVQSQIRGQHATGLAWINNGQVIIEKRPVPATEFVEEFDSSKLIDEETGDLFMIGHCRYSTSDLKFNQPIASRETVNVAVVHNGVISQEPPERWEELYDAKTATSNDSELLLHSEEHPLLKYHPSSQAVCMLTIENGTPILTAWRNEARPLWRSYIGKALVDHGPRGIVFTSTKDIAQRSGFKRPIKEQPYVETTVMAIDNSVMPMILHITPDYEYKDLQC